MTIEDLSITSISSRFPWYEVVEGDELEQGDIFEQCPIFTIDSPFSYEDYCTPDFDVEFNIHQHNVIVMTQSCDITKSHPKVDEVLLCAIWDLEKVAQKYEFARQWRGKEEIRRGNVPGFHMLNASKLPSFERPIRAVVFSRVHSLPLIFMRSLAQARGKRLRLLPPYREHLGQAFARYYMRVGLPVDIPPLQEIISRTTSSKRVSCPAARRTLTLNRKTCLKNCKVVAYIFIE
jgi:hypothetical protein